MRYKSAIHFSEEPTIENNQFFSYKNENISFILDQTNLWRVTLWIDINQFWLKYIFRHQLQELSSSFDNLQVEMKEERVQSKKVLKETEEKYSKMILDLKTEQEEKMRELKQKLELEHELEFDNLKQQLETGELTKVHFQIIIFNP